MKKKKILVGIGIYLLICGIIYSIVFTSRMNYIIESYLKEFRKSPVLKEKFGEIIKIKSGVLVDEYDEEKYVVDIKIYTKASGRIFVHNRINNQPNTRRQDIKAGNKCITFSTAFRDAHKLDNHCSERR